MRYVYPAAATGVVLAFFILAGNSGASSQSITNYQLVGEERVTRTEWYYTYRADLVNPGPGRSSMTASVATTTPNATVVAGRGMLHFAPVPSNGTVTSSDTFTIMVDRSQPFSTSDLTWAFLSPTSNAGPFQSTTVGTTVQLNGSGSTNPSGSGVLSYHWEFRARALGSQAVLLNPDSVMPSFVVDAPGSYFVRLTVSNGSDSDTSEVLISTVNSPPVAHAGADQTSAVGSVVTLNGGGSTDVDGDPLTYKWTIISRPPSSSAAPANSTAVSTTFTADQPGTFVVQLVVNDGKADSAPSTMTVSTGNVAPVANPGPNQVAVTGSIIQLNGAASTDVDGNPLTYSWSLITMPGGSTAALNSTTIVNPTFTADLAGIYIAQLIVNDGTVDSLPVTVTITTNAVQAPTADAGPNQTVVHGTTVTLAGSGTDPQGKPLTFTWSLMTRPPSSVAVLSSTSIAGPSFLADRPGSYVAQLIIGNGTLNSLPATVTITTLNTTPVAVAGANQVAASGTTVTLDGSASHDADSDPLTYSWSLISRPASSGSVIASPLSKTPTLTVDVAGVYVAQLIVNDGYTASAPATTTITVGTTSIMLTPNPLNLSIAPKILRIAVGMAAGVGGRQVKLLNFDPNLISAPSEVTIPEGQTAIDVTVTPVAAGSTSILVTSDGFQPGAVTVNVVTPTISVSLGAGVIGVGRTTTGTITLSEAAPASGTAVSVVSNPSGVVSIDTPLVSIPAGSSTGSFVVTGVKEGRADLTVASAGYLSGTTSVLVATLGQIVLPAQQTLNLGQSAPLGVSLATPAPAGGVYVTLVSSNPEFVTVPPQVFIAENNVSPLTQPQVTAAGYGTSTITASAPAFLGATQTVQVGGALSFSSPTITVGSGGTQNVTLLLTAPAPTVGFPVTLTSSNPLIAEVPLQVTIPGNQTSVTFELKGLAPGTVNLTGSSGVPQITNATATVNVMVFGVINLQSNLAVSLGGSAPFPVVLTTAAQGAGVTVTLSTSDSAKVGLPTSTVFIPAGQTQPNVQPTVTGTGLGQATITATAPGFGLSTAVVKTSTTLSFSPASTTLNGPETKDLTLTLSAAAPAGGLPVTLSANPAGFITLPATVTIAGGATTATVTVSGLSAGTTTITASTAVPNVASATTSVTVQVAGSLTVQPGITVTPGQAVEFDVSLPAAATIPVTITLTSGAQGTVTVSPSTVTVDVGQTKPAQKPTATGVAFGTAVITASAPGYGSSGATFTVGAALSLTPQNLSLSGTETKPLTVNLSAAAPAGGLPVNLSASPSGIVTLPGSVTIAAGTTSIPVQVTGVAPGSVTITASTASPNVTSGTAPVTVQSGATINLPATIAIGLGKSVPVGVSLSSAPTQDTILTLSSSDTAKFTIAPLTVTILAGQTQPAAQPQLTGKGLGSATVNVAAPFYAPASRSAQVTASLSFTPASLTLTGAESGNLTVTLSAPAPAGGVAVSLSSSATGVATVTPASVTIVENATTATVAVNGVAPGSAVITASGANLDSATATITVKAAVDIIMPATLTVAPGDFTYTSVSLARAQANPVWVALSSSDPSIAEPALTNILIPENSLQKGDGRVKVDAHKAGTVVITATSNGLQSASTTVQVGLGMNLTPANLTITGVGTQQFLSLTLTSPAPSGGVSVTLTSSNPSVATVTSQPVVIQQNVTSVNVQVTSTGVGSAVIHANASGISETTANVTVQASGGITIAAASPMALGQTAPLNLTLSTPAPVHGVTVNFTSSNVDLVEVTPASIFIPEGAVTAGPVTLSGINTGDVTINATATGFMPSNTLAMSVNTTLTWGTPSLSITGIDQTGHLLLSLPVGAPTLGLTVQLTSSNPNIVRVQQSVTFFPDGSVPGTVRIAVNSVGAGTATIHASGVNAPDVAAAVTVTGPPVITTATLPDGVVNVDYNANLAATDGTAPLSWSASGLPSGLTLSPAGVIAGKPAANAVGTNPVVFTVTDSSVPPFTGTRTLQLKVDAGAQATSITAFEGSNQFVPINTAFPKFLKAQVKDVNGNPLAGATVTFAAPATGASGAFAGGNTAVSDALGIATSSQFTANGIAGEYMVNASVTGVGSPAQFRLTNEVGPAASIAVVDGSGQTASINAQFVKPLQVIVKDAGNNPVSGALVTFATPESGAGGSFAGHPTASTNASGVATSTTFTANSLIGQYSVSASVAGVAAPATFQLTNQAGVAASITATDGMGQSAQINTVFGAVLRVAVKDLANNPVSGVTVTFTAPGSNASAGFPGLTANVATDANGIAASPTLTANGTVGSYSVTASVPGVSPSATFGLTNIVGTATSVAYVSGSPQTAAVNTQFVNPLVVLVRDASDNGVSGVSVTFTAPASGATGTFTTTNTVSTNSSGVASSTAFTANTTPGSYVVTAAVGGLPSVAFQLTNAAGAPATMVAAGGGGQQAEIGTAFANPLKVQVKDAFGNPVSGQVVAFTAPVSSASGTFGAGTTTYSTDVNGYATTNTFTANNTAGAYNVTATLGALPAVSFAMTNTTPSGGNGIITVSTPTIGRNLQAPITFQFSPAVPAGTMLTVTSGNAALALLGSGTSPGTAQVQAALSGGETSVSTYVKALAATGSVTITVAAPGYATATGTVTFAPSGFVISGSQGIGGNFSNYKGEKTTLTVYAARLNSSGAFAENQEVRGGYTVSVPVTSVPASVGTITGSPVLFTGTTLSANAQFSAVAAGSATIAAEVPNADFTNPVSGDTMTATVQDTGVVPFTATIGKNLQVPAVINLNGTSPTAVDVVITSNDSSKLKFSATQGGTGLASITVRINANRSTSPEFYAQGFAATGSMGYTVNVPGFGNATGSVDFAPSGFVIRTANGIGQDFSMIAGVGAIDLEVLSARISPGGAFLEQQALAGGVTANVNFAVGSSSIGSANPAILAVTGGTFGGSFQFVPAGPSGSTTITASEPNYTPATAGTVTATVQGAVMFITGDMQIGKNLQQQGSVLRTVPLPTELQVTLTSSNPSLVLLSATADAAGTDSIIITIPANGNSASYFVQGVADQGTATYSVQAPGFPNKSGTVTLSPSGIVISGDTLAFLEAGPVPVSISPARLDSVTLAPVETQMLAGGSSPTDVFLTSSDTAAGTIVPKVTLLPGVSTIPAMFTPQAVGGTTLTIVSQPAGFSTPTSQTTLNVSVLSFFG